MSRAHRSAPLGESPSTRELLRRLDLDVRMRLDGLLQGDYRGLVPGHGSEPGETREYIPGDDVRRIDWNVTARLQHPHVRQTIADRELETHILVDLSPSIDFGTVRQEKRDVVLSAVGALALLTSRVGNRVGGILLRPDGFDVVPAKQGRAHILGFLHRLANSSRAESGSTDLGCGIQRISSQARRRGLVVVVSDFISPDGWQQPLAQLAVKHDVLAVEVLDPRELELPDVGLVTFTDPETGTQRDIATGRASVRKRYAEAATQQRRHIEAELRKASAAHLQLRTDGDCLIDLVTFVANLRKRATVRNPA